MASNRLQCKECGIYLTREARLHTMNPFDLDSTIYGCPQCKGVEGFMLLCEHEGCSRPASIGTPFPAVTGGMAGDAGRALDGDYYQGCWDHAPENFKNHGQSSVNIPAP